MYTSLATGILATRLISKHPHMTKMHYLQAGNFSSWLRSIRKAIRQEKGMTVTCGKCRACCTSSYFIHIRPHETTTLSHIPKKALFPAPGLSKGNMLLGYDENGHCPMFKNNNCSIYKYRPLTCRMYDCRIFTATGIKTEDRYKTRIHRKADLWKFSYVTKRDRDLHAAVRTTAKFIQEHKEFFPATVVDNTSQLAILAIKTYTVFLRKKVSAVGNKTSSIKMANKITGSWKKFDRKKHL